MGLQFILIPKAVQQLPCFFRYLAMYIMCMSGKSLYIYLIVFNQHGHLHYIIFHFRRLGGPGSSLQVPDLGTATWQRALLISGGRKCGIQTVVISLLAHRLFHKHKGILLLFALRDTHQTIIVTVSGYAHFKHQFWPDKNDSGIQRK